MKASELQIGDWVRVLPISRKVEAHNSQVGALTRNVNNTINIEGGYFPSWRGWCVSEEYIEPIPLTVEILKLNGFEKDKYEDTGISIYDKNTNTAISYSNKGYLGVWSNNDDVCVLVQKISYVHELQHALRLCGLNEFVKNLKVE